LSGGRTATNQTDSRSQWLPLQKQNNSMKNINIIRAWKDQAYRNSLTPAQRAALPENPAGSLELNAAQAGKVTGGASAVVVSTTSLASKTHFWCFSTRKWGGVCCCEPGR
jgi:mersacidin/lichenicidin family type 2 lantibiotic